METIEETHRVLDDAAYREHMVELNYAAASEFFSYDTALFS